MKIENIALFLRKFFKSSKTGRLIVDKDRIRREHYFFNSRLVYSVSNAPNEKFGTFVKIFGIHLQEDVEKLLRSEYQSKIGKRLVELGFIDERILNDILIHQTKEIFISSLKLFNVEYRWESNKENPNKAFSADLALVPLVVEGLRRIEDPSPVKHLLNGELELSAEYPRELEKFLSEKELRTLKIIKAGAQPRASDLNLPEDKFLRILFTLYALGFVKTLKASDLVEELREFHSKVGTVDYWELLGVSKKASSEEIKDAYFRLSKKFHPDRFPKEDKEIQEMASRVFREINTAYEVLSDPKKREEYHRSLAQEKPQKEREFISPESRFKEGKVMFNKRKFKEAAYLFDLALRLAPDNPTYMYWKGVALSKLPGSEKEAEELLLAFADRQPWDPKPFIVLANMYAQRGLKTKALSFVNRALALDPEHPTALKLKNLLEGHKKKGIFDFFKK